MSRHCPQHDCYVINAETGMLDYVCPCTANMIECMFTRQKHLQAQTGNGIMPRLDPKLVAAFSLGLIAELGEVLQVYTSWKPWKTGDVPYDKDRLDEELADMWLFMIDLSLALGYDAQDVVEIFNKKYDIVAHRKEHNKEEQTL